MNDNELHLIKESPSKIKAIQNPASVATRNLKNSILINTSTDSYLREGVFDTFGEDHVPA